MKKEDGWSVDLEKKLREAEQELFKRHGKKKSIDLDNLTEEDKRVVQEIFPEILLWECQAWCSWHGLIGIFDIPAEADRALAVHKRTVGGFHRTYRHCKNEPILP